MGQLAPQAKSALKLQREACPHRDRLDPTDSGSVSGTRSTLAFEVALCSVVAVGRSECIRQ